MYMSFSPSILVFFFSLLLGMGLGALWDIFRIFRLGIPSTKTIIFFQDIIYALLATTITLVFFYIFTSGGFRMFVLIGEFLGFVFYYLTIGRLAFKIFKVIFKVIHKIIWILTLPFRKVFKKLIHIITSLLYKLTKKFKNCFKIKKNLLHFTNNSLYNKLKSKFGK